MRSIHYDTGTSSEILLGEDDTFVDESSIADVQSSHGVLQLVAVLVDKAVPDEVKRLARVYGSLFRARRLAAGERRLIHSSYRSQSTGMPA